MLHRYFEFSDKGGDFDSPRSTGRIYLCGMWPWEIGEGKLIGDWNFQTVLRLADDSPVQDMPWIYTGYIQAVSDRMKSLLSIHAPRCVQYLPVRAFQGCQQLPSSSYWIANWLPVVDCIDWRLSKVRNKDPKVKLVWPRIIDLNKTGGSPLLIVKEQLGWVLLRADLKEMLQREGITGCQYGTIEQHD